MSAIAKTPIDALPIVCAPGQAAANNAPATMATIGDLIAALQDQADAMEDNAEFADAIVVEAMFGMQYALRYASDIGEQEIDSPMMSSGRAA